MAQGKPADGAAAEAPAVAAAQAAPKVAAAQSAQAAQAVAQQWLALEQEVRGRGLQHGVVAMDQLAATDGLTFMRRWLAGELPGPPFGKTVNFVLVAVDRGEVVFQGTPTFEHYNPLGGVHGGYMATLLDSCVGCAVHTVLPQGRGYTTLELKVNFVRAVTDKVGPMRAIGKVINLSRQIAIADGRLVDSAGRLYATASTTCLVFPLPV